MLLSLGYFAFFHSQDLDRNPFCPKMATINYCIIVLLATKWILSYLHVMRSLTSHLWRDQRNWETLGQFLTGPRQGQTASVIMWMDSQSEASKRNNGVNWSSGRCCRRGSHLTRVDAAREELVQLDQLVWGDVEFESDAVEGIIRSHL